MDDQLETKMREWIDRNEIWAVMQRYSRGIDRADAELLRSVYWPDAIDDHVSFVGTAEEFIAWVTEALGNLRCSHFSVSNHVCELDGDDAYAETYYQAIGVGDKAPFRMSCGRYVDHLKRRNGEWRILGRVTVIDGVFDLHDNSQHSTLLPMPGENSRRLSTRDRSDVSYDRPPVPRQPGATS